MSRSFYNQSGVRQRATTSTNSRNDVVLSWANPSTLTITGVRLQPLKSEEIRPGFTGEIITHRLLAPYQSDIAYRDRWVQDGVTYEVDGSPEQHNSPTGAAQHDEVYLRRVVG
jgi:hypothetical protein